MSEEAASLNVEQPEMPILEHLGELRDRVVRALIAVIIATAFTLVFAQALLEILTQPYCQHIFVPDGSECTELVALQPTEALETFFRVAITAGAIVAMPVILYQLWLFISPGLHDHEKRYVYVFVPAAFGLFITGVLFSWFVLLPPALAFLVNFLDESIDNQWQLQPYIEFVTSFLFWLGVSFEMPLIFYFLARFGIITTAFLRENWRFAIVGIAILAAIITPSVDPVTMSLTMIPLFFLYLLSILLSRVGERQFKRLGGRTEPDG